MVVPTFVASFLPQFKGDIDLNTDDQVEGNRHSLKMLILGLSAIVFVPIFKVVTHLPPYLGMMLSLGVVSIFAEIFSNSKYSLSSVGSTESGVHVSPVHKALTKIEITKYLIFLRYFNGCWCIRIFGYSF